MNWTPAPNIVQANRQTGIMNEDSLDKWPDHVHQGLAHETQVLDHGPSQFLGIVGLHCMQNPSNGIDLCSRLFYLPSRINDEAYLSKENRTRKLKSEFAKPSSVLATEQLTQPQRPSNPQISPQDTLQA